MSRRWIWRLATGAALAATLMALASGPYQVIFGSVTGSVASSRHAPCLPGLEVPVLDSPHIPEAEGAGVRYNSQPPTSGPHFAFTVATGIYDSPVPPGLYVHAMEHGHVVIHYSPDTPPARVDALKRIARRYGADVVMFPDPAMGGGIALTAWGRLDRMIEPDEPRISAFIERLSGRYVHGWSNPTDC
ncbi:DUF3105 domain-containing protein [Nonomuraea sp. NPDC003754]